MSRGLSNVWLPVDDMERAVAFYRDVLGLEVTQQSDEWTQLDADGVTLALNARRSEGTSGPGDTGGAVLVLRAQGSLEDDVQALEGQGVTFPDGIAERPWGRVAAFSDPDGNSLELYGPPQG